MEDVAARETETLFEIERRERRMSEEARAEVGGVCIDGVDDELRCGLAHRRVRPAAPRRLGTREIVIEMLAEEARHMRTRRCERVIERRGDHHLDHRRARYAVQARFGEGAVHVAERGRDDDAGTEVRIARARAPRAETRQLRERDVHAERGRPDPPALDMRAEVLGQIVGLEQAEKERLGSQVADDVRRAEHASVGEPDAARAHAAARAADEAARCAARDDALDRRVALDVDAEPTRFGGHRLRDRAHATDGVAPDAALSVDLTEGVVQQHIGAARRVGARVVADDGIEAVERLERIALEPVVEDLARTAREELVQFALRGER